MSAETPLPVSFWPTASVPLLTAVTSSVVLVAVIEAPEDVVA